MPGFKKHGWTFSTSGLMGEEILLTADPENLRTILQTNFSDYRAGELRRPPFRFMLGQSIFTSDGAFWKHSRVLFHSQLARNGTNDLEATSRAVTKLFHAIKVQRGGQTSQWTGTMDLKPLLLRMTLDISTEFLFGVSVESQSTESQESCQDPLQPSHSSRNLTEREEFDFCEAFHIASLQAITRAKLQKLYWLADSWKARRAARYLHNFIDQVIQETSSQSRSRNEKKNLLLRLMEDIQDPVELRYQALFLLTASRDTTASLLSWMILMLASNPTVFTKLRSEIITTFGTTYQSSNVTYTSIQSCEYLQWVMLETLRLYPPGPLNTRVAARDTVLPVGGGKDKKGPVAIRKGQTVNMCFYALHRRPDIWGEDVLQFRPERWKTRPAAWEFLPFSGGPRTCLGKDYALVEAGFVTIRLLQQFDRIEIAGDCNEIPQFVIATLEPKEGVMVRLRRS